MARTGISYTTMDEVVKTYIDAGAEDKTDRAEDERSDLQRLRWVLITLSSAIRATPELNPFRSALWELQGTLDTARRAIEQRAAAAALEHAGAVLTAPEDHTAAIRAMAELTEKDHANGK